MPLQKRCLSPPHEDAPFLRNGPLCRGRCHCHRRRHHRRHHQFCRHPHPRPCRRCRCHRPCHCHCDRPLPSLLPSATALAVFVNHCRRHLCCVAVSHHCRQRPCRWPLPSPSLSAIAVAIAIGHHHCHAVGHFRELLPWCSKNCIQPIEAKNANLFLCLDSGRCTDQSRMTDQVSSSDGKHQRWAASGKK